MPVKKIHLRRRMSGGGGILTNGCIMLCICVSKERRVCIMQEWRRYHRDERAAYQPESRERLTVSWFRSPLQIGSSYPYTVTKGEQFSRPQPGCHLPNSFLVPEPFTKSFLLPIHCNKRLAVFPVPSRDVTYQTLPGREYLNYSRPRVW
jgi:hypothetical protein